MRRVLSIVEGTYVTGPIRPLLMVAPVLRHRSGGGALISLLTTARGAAESVRETALVKACNEAEVNISVVQERRAFDTQVIPQLTSLVRTARPHIVETHDVKCHLLLYAAMKFGGLQKDFRWIAYHHGYTKTSWRVRLYKHLDRLSLRSADVVLTVCKPFGEQIVAVGVDRSRLRLIENPAPLLQHHDDLALDGWRTSLGLDVRDRVIVTVGRLSAEKGIADLISAIPMLRAEFRGSQTVLLVVGDGPERAALENLAKFLRCRVIFAGHQPDVAPFLQLAAVFVMPSHSEGSPLALLEAMAMSCPIIATSVGGIPEVLKDDENGLLVDASDSAALASALDKIFGNRSLARRLGDSAAASAVARSVDSYADRLNSIYAEADL